MLCGAFPRPLALPPCPAASQVGDTFHSEIVQRCVLFSRASGVRSNWTGWNKHSKPHTRASACAARARMLRFSSGFSLVLLLVLLLAPPAAAAGKFLPRQKRKGRNSNSGYTHSSWKAMRDACSRGEQACGRLPAHTEEDCILKCLAPSCHHEVYADDPLEPGQVDNMRSGMFQRCLRDLEGKLRAARLWPPRMNGEGTALVEPEEGDGGKEEKGDDGQR